MSDKFKGWVIFSDVDGTILTIETGMCKRNMDALKYFTDNGGGFSIVSGRGRMAIDPLPCIKYVNFPCGLANGAILYDAKNQKQLSALTLPPQAREITLYIRNQFPDIRIMAWDLCNRYEVGAHVNLPADPLFSSIENLPNPWSKVVFWVNPEQMATIEEYIRGYGKDLVDITSSCSYFIEMIPHGASKGNAVENLIAKFDLDSHKVIVMGDYLNDLSLFELSDVKKICPQNSHPLIKSLSDKVVCSVDEGALADVIEMIDNGDFDEKA